MEVKNLETTTLDGNQIFAFAMALTFAVYVLVYILFLVLELLTIMRWKLNYDILRHGRSPENPIKLSIMYQADFFKVKEKLPNGIIKIAGIELNLGFKECVKNIYVRFPKNMYSCLIPGRMYDFKMKPI